VIFLFLKKFVVGGNVSDTIGFSRMEFQFQPNKIQRRFFLDTIGFSRMEFQFQPNLLLRLG
jgi:hypothetical protein